MEFFAEFILEFLLEIFGHIVEESKVKTWIKTVFVSIVAQGLTAAFTIMSVLALRDGNSGGYIVAVIAILWFVGTVIGTIYGHKRNWKNE